ncbi:hypothetical protein AAMO2058_000024800 [Amorphochlora amoebiformis]
MIGFWELKGGAESAVEEIGSYESGEGGIKHGRNDEEKTGLLEESKDEASGGLEFRVNSPYLGLLIMAGGVGSFVRGYDLGVMGSALLPMKRAFDLTDVQTQLLVAMVMPMAATGSLFAGSVADKLGRKAGLLTALFFITGGVFLMGTAVNYEILLTGRCIAGLGLGMTFVVPSMYCAEVSPVHLRGRLTMSNPVLTMAGMPLGFLGTMLINDWRWAFHTVTIFGALSILIVMFGIPDSPRWLLSQKRGPEAEDILRKTVSSSETAAKREEIARQRLVEMKQDMDRNKKRGLATWKEVLLSKENSKNLAVGLSFASLCPLIGVEAIFLYAVYTLTQFGMSERTGNVIAIVMGLVHLISNLTTTAVIDNPLFGRRGPLLTGAMGILVSVSVMSAFGFIGNIPGELPASILILYASAYGLGYGSLSLTIVAELFVGPYRSKSLALCGVFSRVFGFIVTIAYISLVESIGVGGVYLILTAIAAGGWLFCYSFIPELQGKAMGFNASHDVGMPKDVREAKGIK